MNWFISSFLTAFKLFTFKERPPLLQTSEQRGDGTHLLTETLRKQCEHMGKSLENSRQKLSDCMRAAKAEVEMSDTKATATQNALSSTL